MADPIRLHAEFTDDLGTTYKLNIHQQGFGASSTEFNLGADGFTLRYSGNNEDRMQPIIGSEVTFTFIENVAAHTTFLTALATSEDADFTVSIFKDPDGANTLFWTGVLLHEQVELQDEAFPIQNTLTAVDDLGNLKNIKYDDNGSFYTGQETIAAHLNRLLNKTRALHVYASGDVFLKYANDFKPTTFLSVNAFVELLIAHGAFYNQDNAGNAQGLDCFTVLKNFAITFNARVFFAEGCFYFVPLGSVENNSTIDFFTVTKAGTVSASATAINTLLTVDTDMKRLRGGVTTFLPPLNKVQRVWRTDANLPLLGPVTQYLNTTGILFAEALGTVINDDQLAYDNGTEFRIRFAYAHEIEGDSSITGEDRWAYLVLKIQIKVGNLYYNNTLSAGQEFTIFYNPDETFNVNSMSFTNPAWSSSPGHFHIPVTAGNSYIDLETGFCYAGNGGGVDTSINLGTSGNPTIIDLQPITSAQTGISVTVNVQGYDRTVTEIPNLTTSSAFGFLENFGMHAINGGATNGDQVVYEANTTSQNQEVLTQDEVVIGSGVFPHYRNFKRNDVNTENVDSFASFANSSATLSIHQLAVKEILAGQNNSIRVKRGTLYKTFVSPLNVVKFSTRNFLPFETAFIARAVQAEYEAFHIASDNTNISTPTPVIIDTHEPINGGEPSHGFFGLLETSEDTIAPHIFERFLQQPVHTLTTRSTRTDALTSVQQVTLVGYAGSAGTGTIQLPAVANYDGAIITIVANDTVSASNIVSVVPASGDTSATINGASSFSLNTAYESVQFLCSGGQWYIV